MPGLGFSERSGFVGVNRALLAQVWSRDEGPDCEVLPPMASRSISVVSDLGGEAAYVNRMAAELMVHSTDNFIPVRKACHDLVSAAVDPSLFRS